MTAVLDEYQLAARTLRATKDKSYRQYPMGQEAGAYLRWKRGQITAATYRSYESILDKLARYFPDLEIAAFEPPAGTDLLEEFLDTHCGELAPGTYNTYHAILRDFFKWARIKGKLAGDPMLLVNRRRKRGVHRAIFSEADRLRVLTNGPDERYRRRDRIALRLLLDYGIRKGALKNIQFEHFDFNRRRLVIFTKGEKVRELPIVDPKLWDDLEKHMREIKAEPHHYLVSSRKNVFWKYGPNGEKLFRWFDRPEKPFSDRGLHEWWYGCLQRAGVVATGTSSGKKMHMARHTAGQRVLDRTGNIKAVQKLLGHANARTTMDVYVDWDDDQLESTLRDVLLGD